MSIPFFVTGGPVPHNSPFYIERAADNQARRHLERMEYIKIIEPRQQGKTSLINRLAHTAGNRYVFAYINALRLDKTDEISWYASLYHYLLDELPIITQDTQLKAPTNGSGWGDFLTKLAVRAEHDAFHLVIAFDELGDVSMDWGTGFFSNIRAIFDERLHKPCLTNLTFILAGTYNPRALMNDPTTSPFNVAQHVPLPDFTLSQIRQLVNYLNLPNEDAVHITQCVRYWTDGQPYFTQCLCRRLAESHSHLPLALVDVDRAAHDVSYEDTNHLPRILEQLESEQNLPLRKYAERVLNGHSPEFRPAHDSHYHSPLALIGILKADEQRKSKIRNQIYEQAFRNAFIHSELEEENNMSDFADGYALIIGIAHYPKVRKLPEMVMKDARDIQTMLRSSTYCGYRDSHVRLLLNDQATADGIRAGLRWLAESAGLGATALVFFSGHGGRVEDGSQISHYLIPYDCNPVNLDGTAISGEELTRLLRDIKAQRLLVCFDSCYSGGAGETKGLGPEQLEFKLGLEDSYFTRLAQGTGRVIMASSRSDETSLILWNMANSLFTHYLLEALRGQAPTHNDGLIRVFDVFHYITENVPKSGSQHPIFKATDLENNFPIALYLGGKEVSSLTDAIPPQQLSIVDKRALRRVLVQQFTLEGLQALCADIEQDLAYGGIKFPVNLDLVGGTSQEGRVLNLMRYLGDKGYLDYLIAAVRQQRPGAF